MSRVLGTQTWPDATGVGTISAQPTAETASATTGEKLHNTNLGQLPQFQV